MKLMLKCQIDRHKKRSQTGGAAKISKAKMDELAEHVALVHWLAREVQSCVTVSDQTMSHVRSTSHKCSALDHAVELLTAIRTPDVC